MDLSITATCLISYRSARGLMHGTEQAIENLDFSDQKTARHWRKALSLWEERVDELLMSVFVYGDPHAEL